MIIKIEIDGLLTEDEITIRCRQIDSRILKLQDCITDIHNADRCLLLRQGEKEYYIPLDQILFFETEGKIIQAHTSDQLFETEYKLYELEEILPGYFMRISKSSIVNLNFIYSITRNLTASSEVAFAGSSKKVYVSRNYYKVLIERLGEKRRKL